MLSSNRTGSTIQAGGTTTAATSFAFFTLADDEASARRTSSGGRLESHDAFKCALVEPGAIGQEAGATRSSSNSHRRSNRNRGCDPGVERRCCRADRNGAGRSSCWSPSSLPNLRRAQRFSGLRSHCLMEAIDGSSVAPHRERRSARIAWSDSGPTTPVPQRNLNS